MERINPQEIASAILAAPAWAIIGLTMPDERMRECGADELARVIAASLGESETNDDTDQLRLPLAI